MQTVRLDDPAGTAGPFGVLAGDAGVSLVVSLPLVADQVGVGSLNIYACAATALPSPAEAAARDCALMAAIVLGAPVRRSNAVF